MRCCHIQRRAFHHFTSDILRLRCTRASVREFPERAGTDPIKKYRLIKQTFTKYLAAKQIIKSRFVDDYINLGESRRTNFNLQ